MIQTATGVLEELSEHDSAMVEACVPVVDVDYGATLAEMGENVPSLLWIIGGEVVLQLDGMDVLTAGRGDVIGAEHAIGDPFWPVTVKCIQPTRLLWVDRTALLALGADGNPFAAKLERAALATMSRQLRALDDLIAARAAREDLPHRPTGGFGWALRQLLTAARGRVDVEELLREARLFEDESDPTIEALAGVFSAVTIPKGNAVTLQGDPSERVLLHVDGAIEAFVAADGEHVARLGPVPSGALLGLSAGIPPTRHTVSRIALEDVHALEVSAEDFNDLIEANTETGAAMRRAAIHARGDALTRDYQHLRALCDNARYQIRSSLREMDTRLYGGR